MAVFGTPRRDSRPCDSRVIRIAGAFGTPRRDSRPHDSHVIRIFRAFFSIFGGSAVDFRVLGVLLEFFII